nr:MAG TPA: hypothetical protein [Caudoviricetes sp.]
MQRVSNDQNRIPAEAHLYRYVAIIIFILI